MIGLTGIPVLETERLILRGPEAKDEADYVAFFTSDRAQYVGGSPDHIKAFQTFALEIGHWVARGFGMWAVTMKGDDRALGYVGCWRPGGWPENELGWILWPQAEGKGIGFEAATAARDQAYGALGWTTAVSYIDEPNARSIRLAERLGCVQDPDAPPPAFEDDAVTLVYRHPGPEELT